MDPLEIGFAPLPMISWFLCLRIRGGICSISGGTILTKK